MSINKIIVLNNLLTQRLSRSFLKKASQRPEYLTFEGLRSVASLKGGFIPLSDVSVFCGERGISFKTVRDHIRKCVRNGWVLEEKIKFEGKMVTGFRWVGEEKLHEELVGRSWEYLGKDSVKIEIEKLQGMMGKSKKEFRRWIVVNVNLREFADMQTSTLSNLRVMASKVACGESVNWDGAEVGLDWVGDRFNHYNSRRFEFDGSFFSEDLVNANSRKFTRVHTAYKKEGKQKESTDQVRSHRLDACRVNAVCPIDFGVPRAISYQGREFYAVDDLNVTTVYSDGPLGDVKFVKPIGARSGPLPGSGLSAEGGILGKKPYYGTKRKRGENDTFKTQIIEANVSLSTLSKHTGWSSATLSRYLRTPSDDLIVRDNIMVIGAYNPATVNAINIHVDQSKNSLRARYHARRVSQGALIKAQARGTEVTLRNIGGSIEDLEQSKYLTALAFQRQYFIIDRIGDEKCVGDDTLAQNEEFFSLNCSTKDKFGLNVERKCSVSFCFVPVLLKSLSGKGIKFLSDDWKKNKPQENFGYVSERAV